LCWLRSAHKRACRSRRASAVPGEYGQMACQILENGYPNGETIRLDGAIRMASR
jgi:hypothetical protein